MNKIKSLFEYRKSLKDWHYDPMIESVDYEYVGRFEGIEKYIDLIEWPEMTSGVSFPTDNKSNEISLPEMQKNDNKGWGYTPEATRKYHLFDNIPDKFYEIGKLSGLDNITLSILKQPAGATNPWHYDTHYALGQKLNLSQEEIISSTRRYLVMLEDWHWGHFVQIGNNILTQWKAGDIFSWPYGMWHTSANAGIKPKLSFQITGVVTKNSLHKSSMFKIKV
jgi:hypothetical protein